MTNQPPRNLGECSDRVNEAVEELISSGLTDKQKQQVATLVNAYLYVANLAEKLDAIAKDAVDLIKDAVI
jgi:predicted transcriptional regulator